LKKLFALVYLEIKNAKILKATANS